MGLYQIPAKFLPGFRALSSLKPADVIKISKTLNQMPVGSSQEEFSRLLRKDFKVESNEELADTIFSLGSFIMTQDFKPEVVSRGLAEAFTEELENENFDDKQEKELAAKILSIFSEKGNFKLTIKAMNLLVDNEKTYRDAKILTDIRMVFDDDIADKNRHGLIIHNLKIEFTENDETKYFYASLDSGDLVSLKEQIDRAMKKEVHMKETYKDLRFIDLNSTL